MLKHFHVPILRLYAIPSYRFRVETQDLASLRHIVISFQPTQDILLHSAQPQPLLLLRKRLLGCLGRSL